MANKQQQEEALQEDEMVEEAVNQESQVSAETESANNVDLLTEITKQLEAEKAARLMLLADFTNFRKRAEKEREDIKIEANKNMLAQVIEIVDDFDRAVQVEADKIDTDNDFYKGVMLIHKKLTDLLSDYGLVAIEAKVGDELDPMTMQAVATAPLSDAKQANKIIHLAGRGYINKQTGRVFKTAKVIIGKA